MELWEDGEGGERGNVERKVRPGSERLRWEEEAGERESGRKRER